KSEAATFVVKNPKRPLIQTWLVEKLPRFKLPGDIEVQVGELTVRAERIHPNDIWENIALLPMRVTNNGQALTNWGIYEARVWDASGNFDYFGARKTIT